MHPLNNIEQLLVALILSFVFFNKVDFNTQYRKGHTVGTFQEIYA